MKKIILILFLIAISFSFATEIDDLKFAIGLYSDGNDKLAKTELNSFIHKYPNSKFLDDAKFFLANTLLKQKAYAHAKKYYSYLYEKSDNPTIRAEVMQGLAQSYFMLENYTKAEQIFENFRKEFADHDQISQALYFLGKIQQKRQDFQTALTFYRQAEEVAKSQLSKIKAAKMEVLISLDENAKVDELYDDVLKNATGKYRDLTIILWIENKIEKQEYDKIISNGLKRINSDSSYYLDYRLLLGITYFELGDFSEVATYLQDLKAEKAEYYLALSLLKENVNKAKEILEKLQKSENEELAVNSYFYLAKIEENRNRANEKLKIFIHENPNHPFIGSAYFQIGYNNFVSKNYQVSKENLINAKKYQIDNSNLEKANYLLAESLYQLKEYQLADEHFSKYLAKESNMLFRDEAIYKRALGYYRNKDFVNAMVNFNKLESYPESDKLAMSRFYSGEIYLLQNKLDSAKKAYRSALEGRVDVGFTHHRLAKIALVNKDFSMAMTELSKVPNEERYLFEKNLLSGDILFAQSKYNGALEKFIAAEKYTLIASEQEKVLAKKAWTLYQLKKFDQAAKIYERLAGSSVAADDYIFKAANAAFSAEDYALAISLFTQYQNNFSQQKYLLSAQVAIADSYYNLGNYSHAIEAYKFLFKQTSEMKILKNALNGLRWSCQLAEMRDFAEISDELLNREIRAEVLQMLLTEKVEYVFEEKKWQLTIAAVNELEKRDELEIDLFEYKLMQALSYAHIDDVAKARKLFEELDFRKTDAELLYNWAILELNENNLSAAGIHLKKAISVSKRADIWLKLLEIETEELENYYQQFIVFANEYDSQKAELRLINWKIDQENFQVIDALGNLKKSKRKDIQAKAQYLLGYNLYKQNNLEDAVRELLRVRYLYPEINDVRIEAEYLACISYIEENRNDEAKQLFDVIEAELQISRKSELEKMLREDN